ncbi:MAG: hypothetical protein AB1631_07780 [Acidobacteriota bacterium]
MRTRLKLRPGQKGTKRLVEQYGDRLVCVRYRYDEVHERRFKTIELIVEDIEWRPRGKMIAADTIVDVRVEWGEKDLAIRVKQAGGRWNRQKRAWEMRYDRALELGLEERVVPQEAYNNRYP